MPMYDLRCVTCDERTTVFRRIADYDNLPLCSCGAKTERLVVAPSVLGSFEPYVSPGTGKWVESRTQRAEDLRRSGAFLAEPGVKQDIARRRTELEEKKFAPLSAAIDETVARLVNEKKIES